MKKILIVWALSRELNIVKREIQKLNLIWVKTSFLTTWIWNYNMILNLTKFLEKNDFDLIVNIWVCWYCLDYSDFIQVWRIKNLSNNKELLIPKIIDFWVIDSIASSEKVVYSQQDLSWEKYVDMESYWFEMVCDSFKIPRLILKVPVDMIWDETKNFDFQKAEKFLEEKIDYITLFERLISYIDNHFSVWKWKYKYNHDEIEKYSLFFKFSFTETEIFKRLYFRYLALVNKDFDLYFEENKTLNKKEFLKSLEKFLEDYLVR